MEELKEDFPEGVDYEIRYDTTPFIRESINEVFKTLREAVILVAVVVLLFLQNWRSAVIPLIAVPVAIVGTFAVMAVLGFSLNNLTLFGLVLAIGIVVDDAIVVVEAVEHHIEHGMAPREATYRAMEEVSGPVIAVGLVLTAVFVPCAFITGITGQFFRQFALTIAVSTIISAFNSLTLSPALAALLLRSRDKETHEALPRLAFVALGGWLGWQFLGPWLAPHLESTLAASVQGARVAAPAASSWVGGAIGLAVGMGLGWLVSRPLNRLFGGFFRLFNLGFKISTHLYTRIVGLMLRVGAIVLLVYGGLLYLTYWGFINTPTGFIPSQDMGYLLVNVQLPDAASAERTQEVMERLQRDRAQAARGQAHRLDGRPVASCSTPSGRTSARCSSSSTTSRSAGPPSSTAMPSPTTCARCSSQVTDAQVAIFPPPPVRGVGRAGGFKIMVEDRGDAGPSTLQGQTDNLVEVGNKVTLLDTGDKETPALVGLSSVFRANVPQLFADVDRTRVHEQGRGPQRLVRDAAGLPGLALRQRLQPLRPDLAGDRPGRSRVPRTRSRTSAA